MISIFHATHEEGHLVESQKPLMIMILYDTVTYDLQNTGSTQVPVKIHLHNPITLPLTSNGTGKLI